MENFLINYLLKNCVTLAKEFFSSEKTTPEAGNNALNFLNLLEVKMGSGISISNADRLGETASKEVESETPGENSVTEDDLKEPSVNFFDTQSILTLLQTYFKTQDIQDNALNTSQNSNPQAVTIEKFLQNVFSLLQEGESVQFVKEKSMGSSLFLKGLEKQKEKVVTGQRPVVELGKAMENNTLISYLASVLLEFDALKKPGEKVNNIEAENQGMNVNEYGKPQNIEVLKMFGKIVENIETVKVIDGTVKPVLNKTEMPVRFENENSEHKEALTPGDVKVRHFPNTEEKKLNDRGNVFQIISNGLSSGESDETNKNISVLTVKIEKPVLSHDNDLPRFISNQSLSGESDEVNKNISVLTVKSEKVVSSHDDDVQGAVARVSDRATNDYTGPDERQLLSQNDFTKTGARRDKEAGKALEKTSFSSIMTDRIEKIVEQYANKSVSMDMVVRLRIDEKETLLVGLKEQGQRVIVEVKTTNESMGTFLQSQKEEIARQLEGKHIHANIYVDLQNENREKREQRNNQKKQRDEQEQKDFGGFLEAMA